MKLVVALVLAVAAISMAQTFPRLPRQMFGRMEGRLTGKITGTFTGTVALDGLARKAHETTDFVSNGYAGKTESNTHCITPYSGTSIYNQCFLGQCRCSSIPVTEALCNGTDFSNMPPLPWSYRGITSFYGNRCDTFTTSNAGQSITTFFKPGTNMLVGIVGADSEVYFRKLSYATPNPSLFQDPCRPHASSRQVETRSSFDVDAIPNSTIETLMMLW